MGPESLRSRDLPGTAIELFRGWYFNTTPRTISVTKKQTKYFHIKVLLIS